jgi:hypothetical protein
MAFNGNQCDRCRQWFNSVSCAHFPSHQAAIDAPSFSCVSCYLVPTQPHPQPSPPDFASRLDFPLPPSRSVPVSPVHPQHPLLTSPPTTPLDPVASQQLFEDPTQPLSSLNTISTFHGLLKTYKFCHCLSVCFTSQKTPKKNMYKSFFLNW